MWLFLRASDSVKKIMAGAIAVQQHDDVVNLSTISHKKKDTDLLLVNM